MLSEIFHRGWMFALISVFDIGVLNTILQKGIISFIWKGRWLWCFWYWGVSGILKFFFNIWHKNMFSCCVQEWDFDLSSILIRHSYNNGTKWLDFPLRLGLSNAFINYTLCTGDIFDRRSTVPTLLALAWKLEKKSLVKMADLSIKVETLQSKICFKLCLYWFWKVFWHSFICNDQILKTLSESYDICKNKWTNDETPPSRKTLLFENRSE